jgi:hypothetical protein
LGACRKFLPKETINRVIDDNGFKTSFLAKNTVGWIIYPDYDSTTYNEQVGCNKISKYVKDKFIAQYGDAASTISVNLHIDDNAAAVAALIATTVVSTSNTNDPIEIN